MDQSARLLLRLGGCHIGWQAWYKGPEAQRYQSIMMASLMRPMPYARKRLYLIAQMGFEPATSPIRVGRSPTELSAPKNRLHEA